MGISISGPVGVENGRVIGNATDQQRILSALYTIRFIRSQGEASFQFMNNESHEEKLRRWQILIGDFQIQFMSGQRGIFKSEESHVLRFPSNRPDYKIAPGDRTLRILNNMLEARLLVTVDLVNQQAHIIRNGGFLVQHAITSGRIGANTPVGLFRLNRLKVATWGNNTKEKARIYKNRKGRGVRMPFPVFFTRSGGHALHAGEVLDSFNGKKGSAGCVRLPGVGIARQLWQMAEEINPSSGLYIPNAYVFVFDRPLTPHQRGDKKYKNRRRGDILDNLFERQQRLHR